MPDLQTREQLERQLDNLCDRYLRLRRGKKKSSNCESAWNDLKENQQPLTISVGFLTELSPQFV